MRYYTPYIATVIVVIATVSVLLFKSYQPNIRDYKYGNPEYETLIQTAQNTGLSNITARLYMGKDNSGGPLWYSVTVEKPGLKETQIFASFEEPVVDKVSVVDGKIKLTTGKTFIDIPVGEIDERIKSPLVYDEQKKSKSEENSTD